MPGSNHEFKSQIERELTSELLGLFSLASHHIYILYEVSRIDDKYPMATEKGSIWLLLWCMHHKLSAS